MKHPPIEYAKKRLSWMLDQMPDPEAVCGLDIEQLKFLADMLDYTWAAGILEGRFNSHSIEDNDVTSFMEEFKAKYPQFEQLKGQSC